jgi:hypothetical protein
MKGGGIGSPRERADVGGGSWGVWVGGEKSLEGGTAFSRGRYGAL